MVGTGVAGVVPRVVVVTSRSFSTGDLDLAATLEQAGCEVRTGPADHDPERLGPLLVDAGCWIAGTGPVTAAHLDLAPQLRLVARYGVGTDAVDLAAASERGVLVTNTPGANSEAVADLALALVLATLRGVTAADREVRHGPTRVRRARQLGSLTVGLVGFGRIGQAVARRLGGFGSTVLAHDPYADPGRLAAGRVRPVGLDELLATSDVISLHAPGDEVLVDAAALTRVRRSAVLVNTARGRLVDEQAVAAALREGRLAAYATDVLEQPGPDGPLLAPDLADRTVLTPHVGGHTVEAVDAMGRGAVEAVLDVLAGREPAHLVRPAGGAS